ncbi:putative na+/dicarboxylate na+/tricarboxylate and phosphate transporter [Operophtera brumata]|uniref:Putative na+/dicarboxylate na+/tricarboxylate and phosphate transporter n=1 Tax=Operophtera brumata TaxID=104452 RepID=A0A0L7LT16_OPEBR|nr:putative na+/dicarboxylate na+/tricarboxylate and phosphate transporter [Operophtera brumata]
MAFEVNDDTKNAFRCMYVVLIMAVYWVLELLPLPVTSMLPIVLFPTMGILDSDKTCAAYMKETNMMFMGGLMIAAGVQHSKLPKRVALWTVQVKLWSDICDYVHIDVGIKCRCHNHDAKSQEEEHLMPSDITICYYLSIAYASTLGGCGTLVGTATNSAFKGIFDSKVKDGVTSMFIVVLMFILPMSVDFFKFFSASASSYPTWGKVIFPPLLDATPLSNTPSALDKLVSLNCNTTYSNLDSLRNLNCTVPLSMTNITSGVFTCNYSNITGAV